MAGYLIYMFLFCWTYCQNSYCIRSYLRQTRIMNNIGQQALFFGIISELEQTLLIRTLDNYLLLTTQCPPHEHDPTALLISQYTSMGTLGGYFTDAHTEIFTDYKHQFTPHYYWPQLIQDSSRQSPLQQLILVYLVSSF